MRDILRLIQILRFNLETMNLRKTINMFTCAPLRISIYRATSLICQRNTLASFLVSFYLSCYRRSSGLFSTKNDKIKMALELKNRGMEKKLSCLLQWIEHQKMQNICFANFQFGPIYRVIDVREVNSVIKTTKQSYTQS